ncbi:MAG TPA: hypothetical protein PKM88_03215, partial [bacterium]|nr:hypothetical protein [bacterium]
MKVIQCIMLMAFVLCSGAPAQADSNAAFVISDSDPIYPVLEAYKATINQNYANSRIADVAFTPWTEIKSEPVKCLFPNLRFVFFSWSEFRRPDTPEWVMGLAGGIGQTVAVDTDGHIVMKIFDSGNYENYGELLTS